MILSPRRHRRRHKKERCSAGSREGNRFEGDGRGLNVEPIDINHHVLAYRFRVSPVSPFSLARNVRVALLVRRVQRCKENAMQVKACVCVGAEAAAH